MFSSVTVKAPAKLNLSLDIMDSGEDDYHLMRTVMQTVDLEDEIIIKKNNLGQINLSCDNENVPQGADNLAYKVALAFFEETRIEDIGVDIIINKNIPMAAGLAGGSADAAGVLVGLNELYETNLKDDKLCEIVLRLGADIPFCIKGGIKLADGIGEIFTPLPQLPECYFVIVKPQESMSTKIAFELFDKFGSFKKPNVDNMVAGIVAQNLDVIAEHMCNEFEEPVSARVPEIAEIKHALLECEAIGASMTGSGTAVFGLFNNKNKAKKCVKILEERYEEVFLTIPIDVGATVVKKDEWSVS
ncbi:MAG: 4-(cytidine 5'-diphospho)-2-C-methyl-D-erythritol kinase [Oscillospiraceae bacterium]|nr:4-(cytidine 5'-diphospho)-2-C-methyl-D-erythritol kinase [Oscillospiraceae bacterium]